MRFRFAAATLAAAVMFVGWKPAAIAAEPDSAQVGQARTAVKELGQGLKRRLMETIKDRGPIAAIGVCKLFAPTLAKKTGAAHGLKIGRTALRVRNPANAPDAWERAVLEDFAAQVKAGKDPSRLEHAETVVGANGAATFRYMKAIPMGAVPCLMCHGAPEPSLKAEIQRLYPQDEATGFKPGDLRGAFTVSAPAPAPVKPPAPAPAASPAP
jgi:hypothetical protein